MEPRRDTDDAIVDLLDCILRDGVILQADVIISVAEVPLVGLQLRAALAGMDTMTRYGLLTGRYPFRTSLAWNRKPVIDEGRLTLPAMLRERVAYYAEDRFFAPDIEAATALLEQRVLNGFMPDKLLPGQA